MNYRIDKEHGPERMYRATKMDFPGKSEEFYQLITQERWKESVRCAYQRFISDKLKKTGFYSPYEADDTASQIMKNLPEELFPNLEEWLNDEPISEIDYGGLSIKKLMEFGKNETGKEHEFLMCLDLMLLYIKDGSRDKGGCYSAFIYR